MRNYKIIGLNNSKINMTDVSNLLCIPFFFDALFEDAINGTSVPPGNAAAASLQASLALGKIFENAPSSSQLGTLFEDFSKCISSPLEETVSSIASSLLFFMLAIVIISIIFVTLFLLFIFYFENSAGAIFSVFIYLIIVFVLRYFFRGSIKSYIDSFPSKVRPCINNFSKGVSNFQTEEINSFNQSICSS